MPKLFHLAEFNFSKAIAPMEDPRMAEFVRLSPIVNAWAEAAPGFVWRYNPQGHDSFNIRPFEDPLIYCTLSVWESVEALRDFVMRTDHQKVMARRKEWFVPIGTHIVMWWIPVGKEPTILEAKAKYDKLMAHGPNQEAFSFEKPFPPG